MKTFLIIIIIYLSYFLLWFIINLLAYYISIVFKKKTILAAIFGLSYLVVDFIEWGILGLLIFYAIHFLFSGKFIAFILLFFFGIGLTQRFLNLIKLPFIMISYYFLNKLANFDFNEQVERGEILDEKGRVIGIIEGESSLNTRLAKYFLLLYIVNLSEIILFPEVRKGFMWGDFIATPFFKIISAIIIFGTLYSIYHRIKYQSFLPQDKRYFLINTCRLILIVYGALYGVVIFLRLF